VCYGPVVMLFGEIKKAFRFKFSIQNFPETHVQSSPKVCPGGYWQWRNNYRSFSITCELSEMEIWRR